MARAERWFNSFTSGEISPRLRARTGTPVYETGAAKVENAIILVEGGVERRMGFRHVGSTKTPSKIATLIAFIFSSIQAYMTEWGHLYVRFYRNGARITDAPDHIVNGTFDTGMAGWTVLSAPVEWGATLRNLRIVNSAGHVEQAVPIPGPHIGEPHTLTFTMSGPPLVADVVRVRIGLTSGGQQLQADLGYKLGTHTLSVTPTASPIYVGFRGNTDSAVVSLDNVSLVPTSGLPVELVTPYGESDLLHLQTAQSADVMVLVDGLHAPHRLIRTSHTAWFLQQIQFFDGPYLPENTRDTFTLVASGPGPTVTLTAAGAGFTPFLAGHVGSTWSLTFGAVTKSVRITAVTDPTHAEAFVIDRIDDNGAMGFVLVGGSLGAGFATPTAVWAEGAWSDVRGYPKVITIGEGRFWFFGTDTEPTGVWADVTDEPANMALGTGLPRDALDFGLRETNAIRGAVFAQTGLVIQSVAGETVANGGGSNDAIVPPGPKTRPATDHGARPDRALPPIRVDRITLFANKTGRKLLGFEFSFDLEAHVAKDLLRRSRHLVGRGGIVGLVYAGDPEPLLYVHTAEGRLAVMTYDPSEEVFGWAGFTLAPTTAGDAVIEAHAVMPNAAGTADELWVITRRVVNGATRRDIERLDPDSGIDLDAHLTYSGPPATILSGLGHAEGETVAVLSQGSDLGRFVVAGAAITLPTAVTEAAVGFDYPSRLQTLPLKGAGDKKGTAKVVVRVHETRAVAITVSTPNAKTQRPPARVVSGDAALVSALLTEDIPVATLGWDEAAQVTIESVGPGPWTILGVGVHAVTE